MEKISNPLVLTIDFGTQSLRTCLINKKGEFEYMVKKPYDPPYISPTKGAIEQHPDFYYDYLIECLTKLCKDAKKDLNRIEGATIATFRDSSVQLDKDLKPLRNSILWLDQRMAKASEYLSFVYRLIFFIVGMRDTIVLNRKRTPAHWIKENEPELWRKVYKYVNISTYLIYKLTGNLIDSTSAYTGHYPMNYKTGKWFKKYGLKGVIFGIPVSMRSDICEAGDLLGTISNEIADKVGLPRGIKLIATGSDKACETIGLGALSRDTAAVSYGTASSIEVSNKHYHEPERFLPSYPAATKGWYNMEVQVYRGYWMLSWFSKNFANEMVNESKLQNMALEDMLNKKLTDIPPGSDGLVLQPYWGPGLKRPLAKGAIIGFSDIHTREHFYKAIIEGIAYALKEGLEGIQKSQHHKVKSILISGGGSQSDAICQITADIFGLPVSRVQTFETTSLGAAISTFHALGEFPSIEEAMKAMSHITVTFQPNEKNHEEYQKLYKKAYTKMFPRLNTIYKDINKINKRV